MPRTIPSSRRKPSSATTRARARRNCAGRSARLRPIARDSAAALCDSFFTSMSQEVSIEEAMKHAFALHQSGRFVDAERIYRQVLAAQPQHFHALQLLGLIALHAGHA